MAISGVQVAATAVGAAAVILKAAEQEALLSGGNYIRDGAPTGLIPRLGLGIARQACLRYGADPNSVDGVNALKFENACRPYLDQQGAGAGPGFGVPVRGGQCVGVRYRFQASYNQPAGLEVVNGDSLLGPVTTRPVIANVNANEKRLSFTARRFPDGQLITWFSFQTLQSNALSLQSFTVTRFDGQPDLCGNPPVEVIQPRPDPTPAPPAPRFNPDVNIDVDLNVVLVAPGAIQVNLGTGPITIDPFADGGGDGGGGVPPGDSGTPGTGIDSGVGGDAEGVAPPGSVIVGLLVSLTETPDFVQPSPDGYYRGAATITMGTAVGRDLNFAGAFLRDGQFVLAEQDFLTHWRVNASVGFNIRVTPYYREVE